LKELDHDNDIWGINEIIEFIFSQPLIVRKRILSEVLGIQEELIEMDIFTEIIEDIADRVIHAYNPPEFSGNITQLEEKVKKNFKKPLYAQGIMNLYTDIYIKYQYFIRNTFESSNSFDEIFEQLIENFSEKYGTDEERKKYVKMLILYIFEQCIIGQK